MFKFLTTWNDKYKEFYKIDEFIEWKNIQENFFEKYKEDFLSILNTYYSLQNEYGEVDLNESSDSDNSLFQNLNNIWEEIKKEIISNKILFRQDNWKLIINVNWYLNSTVEWFVKEKYNYKDEDKFLYKWEHSVRFIYFLKQMKYLDNNGKEELTDYYDEFKSLNISNIDELEKVINFYEKIRLEYLFDKFSFDYNEFDNKYYKVIYYWSKKEKVKTDTESYYREIDSLNYMDDYKNIFLEWLKKEWIIKDFWLKNIRSIENKIDGFIELEDWFKIDLWSFSWEIDNDIWFIWIDKVDKRVIDFIEKVNKYQFNQAVTQTKDKVNYLLNFSTQSDNDIWLHNKKVSEQINSADNVIDKISLKSWLKVVNKKFRVKKIDEDSKKIIDFLVYWKYSDTKKVNEYISKYQGYLESKWLDIKKFTSEEVYKKVKEIKRLIEKNWNTIYHCSERDYKFIENVNWLNFSNIIFDDEWYIKSADYLAKEWTMYPVEYSKVWYLRTNHSYIDWYYSNYWTYPLLINVWRNDRWNIIYWEYKVPDTENDYGIFVNLYWVIDEDFWVAWYKDVSSISEEYRNKFYKKYEISESIKNMFDVYINKMKEKRM